MPMIQRLKWVLITLLFTSFIMFKPINALSEEEYLIVRIIDAEYPIHAGFHEEDTYNFTIFTTYLSLETENPTDHNITITYSCGPYPFPYLRTNLENKSIEHELVFIIEWVEGTNNILPGVRYQVFPLEIVFINYQEANLPIGNYTIWFDYTNCSWVPVPVVKYNMYINVTEFEIAYHFEYTDITEVYTYAHPPEETNFGMIFISALLLIPILLKNVKKRYKL